MLAAVLTFAAEAAKAAGPSKTAFYVAGGLLALWAVVVSLIGIRRHEEWPSSEGVARVLMGISVVLVVAAMAAAVTTG
ncbi:MAG: hypothetical protein ACR2NB_12130 [Solirubrobacteraceae bacterium]